MPCIIKRPDPQTLFNRLKDMFSANVLGGGQVVPETNEWYAVSNDYLGHEVYYSTAEQMWRETDPRYACCDNLQVIAANLGIYPRPATYARGYVKISGTVGAKLVRGLTVQFGEMVYRVDNNASLPATIPNSGYVVVRMSAERPGPDGNGVAVGTDTGTLITPLAGVSSAVTIYGSFCGGREAETCEEFRQRYLRRISHAHRANFGAIVEDLTEFPCVTRVVRRDCSCCAEKNRFDAFVFMDDSFEYGIPPQSALDDMTTWYFGDPQGQGLGVADFGMEGAFYAPTPIPLDIRVANLPCSSQSQLQDIKQRIEDLFPTLTPGKPVCRKMIDAIVIQVLGAACDFDVEMLPHGSASTFCDDFNPECDELPVAGDITVAGGSVR